MTEKVKPLQWYEVIALAEDCPTVVNQVSITGTTRLLLWLVAHHGKGGTGASFLKLPALKRKIGCSHNTLDDAIADLTRARLMFTTPDFDPASRTGGAATRTLNIALLQEEVARVQAENQPALTLKKFEKETRKILKRLEKSDSVTCGPITMEEAKTLTGCLERLATFPFACKAKRTTDGAVKVTVSRAPQV
jgi:hypothetical protein